MATTLGLALFAMAALGFSDAKAEPTAQADLKDAAGNSLGSVTFTQTEAGVLLKGDVKGLPPGPHAIHVHETGVCEPPFTSAGGHFNPMGHKHGFVEGGSHAGDMPNLHVPESGALQFEILNKAIKLGKEAEGTVFDADGSALIIHEGPDDYTTDPTGNAGGRFACGVIK